MGLILSRAKGDTVVVRTSDGDICLTVKSVDRGVVRLDIKAPDEVDIMRGELDSGGGRTYDAAFRR